MSVRVNTNIASVSARRSLASSQRKLETAMSQLSSGSRFADPSSGAADFAISEQLRGQIRGQKAAKMNAGNANSFMQIAEGSLAEQTNILIRMRELAVQSASDTFSDKEREMLDLEFQQLGQELDRIAKTTKFGSTSLLAGESSNLEFQIGPNGGADDVIKFNSNANTTASALEIDGAAVGDKGDARDSLTSIDTALNSLASSRAKFGAVMSRLDSVVNNAEVMSENLEAARSRIADTDVAETASEVFKQQAMTQYQLSILAQANQAPQSVLRLIA